MNAVFSNVRSIVIGSATGSPSHGANLAPRDYAQARPLRTLVISNAHEDRPPLTQEIFGAAKSLLFTESPLALLCPIVLAASHDSAVINTLIDLALDSEHRASRECLAALATTDLKQQANLDRLLGMLTQPGRERTVALKALSSTSAQSVTNKLLELVETKTLPDDADRVIDVLLAVPRNDARIGDAYLQLFSEWSAGSNSSRHSIARALAVGARKTGPLHLDIGANKIRAVLAPDQILKWEALLKELFNRGTLPEQVCLMLGNMTNPTMKVWLADVAFLSNASNEVRAFAAYGARDATSTTSVAAYGGKSSLSHLEEIVLWDHLPRNSAKLAVAFRRSTWAHGVSGFIETLSRGSEDEQTFAAHALIESQNKEATEALITAAVNATSSRVRAIAQSGLTAQDLSPWRETLIHSLESRASAAEVGELSRIFGDDPGFVDAFVNRVVCQGGVGEGEFVARHFSDPQRRSVLGRALPLVK